MAPDFKPAKYFPREAEIARQPRIVVVEDVEQRQRFNGSRPHGAR
jgi:hypothetical protein